jgi:AGZA family xanthine/uracil permease-like MFS transporter
MGGRAAYTLATGLFVGLGGVLGYIPFLAQVLPKAALVPILLFVAADIVEQSFHEVPRKHAMAVTFAMMPNVAQLILIIMSQANGALLGAAADPVGVAAATKLSPEFVGTAGVFVMLAHGFILTGMLWGGALAYLADRRAGASAATFLVAAAFTLVGVIHSTDPDGGVYWPWSAPGDIGWQWAAGYVIVAVTILVLSRSREFSDPPTHGHA